MCIQARRLGLLGEAVAAEQVLSQRQALASQQLTDTAAHSSATSYTAAVATAQTAAVPAAVISQAAQVFTARSRDMAAALAAAAADGSWVAFIKHREAAALLEVALKDAEAQMQSRRDAASTAVSAALQAVLKELKLEHVNADPDATGPQNRPQSAMHCTDCNSNYRPGQSQTQQAHAMKDTTPTVSAVLTPISHQRLCLLTAQQTPLSIFDEQTEALTRQMINALPCSDGNDATWQHAVSALAELLHANRHQQSGTAGGPHSPAAKANDSSEMLAAAVSRARRVGLFQTVQLALQVLHKQIHMAQQAQQAVVGFKMPTAQHVQNCTLAWEQQFVPAAHCVKHSSCSVQPATSVSHNRQAGKVHSGTVSNRLDTPEGAAADRPTVDQDSHPNLIHGAQAMLAACQDEATQPLLQQLWQGTYCHNLI